MKVNDVVRAKDAKRIEELERVVADLKARAAGRSAVLDQEKVNLQAKVQTLTRQVKVELAKKAREEGYVKQVVEAVQALDPLPRVVFHRPKKSKTPITALFHATDWHVGEKTSAAETEGWGNYDWGVAQDRILGQALPRFLEWLDTQRSGYVINDIHLLGTGDFVSGDIHDELRRTNEFPLPIQTANAGDLFGELGSLLAANCEKLYVTEIGADNHSRLVQKPQAKQKTQNSMSYLVYHIANKKLERYTNITINQAEGMKLLFNVGSFAFLGEHGDTVKSWMSIPFYGMERERAREANRRMFDGRGFHQIIMGHWHVPHFGGGVIVGGCLSGTSEYDHACGRLSPPVQTTFLVGKRGPFAFTPFELR